MIPKGQKYPKYGAFMDRLGYIIHIFPRGCLAYRKPSKGHAGWVPSTNLEGPHTQYLRTLVPNTMKGMVSGTKVLKDWVLGPTGN